MSLIRSSMNPEGLYIWGSNDNYHIAYPNQDLAIVPIKLFREAFLAWEEDNLSGDFLYDGFSIKEGFRKVNGIECGWSFTYKGNQFHVSFVTLWYILNSIKLGY